MDGNDQGQLRIEFQKADALRELRPHLDIRVGGVSEVDSARAVMRYLSRVVYAFLGVLLESYPLPPAINIEEFTDRAIQEGLEYANSPAVTKVAGDARIYLVDACRVSYIGALAVRSAPFGSRPPFAAMDYDGDCEKWSRTACEHFLASFRTPERALAAVRNERADDHPLRDDRAVVAAPRPSGRRRRVESHEVERLKRGRATLLSSYKKDTGVSSDWAIYDCAGPSTHSCHKPQFYQWKNGLLSPESQSAISLETFLKERRLPPDHARSKN